MREYELVYIVKADLDENAVNEVQEKVKGWISDAGGQVLKTDLWGKRKLAYPVRKQNDGLYVLMNVQMPPSYSVQLERNLRYLEPVLRFLVTVK
jgi:small subunit ribosomal protein S6